MTEHRLRHAQIGFAHVSLAFAERTLPEDEGNWDLYCPPDCGDLSVDEILDHYKTSDEVMPEPFARALDLPSGATYAEGVERIWEDRSHRRRTSWSSPTPETAARAIAEGEASVAASPVQAEFLRELARLTNTSVPDQSDRLISRKIDWLRDGF